MVRAPAFAHLEETRGAVVSHAGHDHAEQMAVQFTGNSVLSSLTSSALSAFKSGFKDFVVTVPPAVGAGGAPGFDPATVSVVRILIQDTNGGPFQSPDTIVYVDSITSSNGNLNDTFDTDPMTMFETSANIFLPGSTSTHMSTYP